MVMRPKSRNIFSGHCKKTKLLIMGLFWQCSGVQIHQATLGSTGGAAGVAALAASPGQALMSKPVLGVL